MTEHEQVLIVEDDPNDAFFIQRAFQHSGVERVPHICGTVRDAIDYLEGSGRYADRQQFPFPNLLVSDLKMPEQSGFDLLRWIRDHPQFQIIPTVIMSSSELTEDVKLAYCLGANAYLCKPSEAISVQGDVHGSAAILGLLPNPARRCTVVRRTDCQEDVISSANDCACNPARMLSNHPTAFCP